MSTIEVGYWSIRGLAAPLRMMVMYSGDKLLSENYDCAPKADGTGYDGSTWFLKKPEYKAINPLINLPYVKDGDVIVSQSNACFLYLGRKYKMLGSNDIELSQCEQLLCEIMDIRNPMTGFAYNHHHASNADAAFALIEKMTDKNNHFTKLELWLQQQKASGKTGHFLVGESATAPDFHLYEMLVQYEKLCSYYSLPSFYGTSFALLLAFKTHFESLPANAKYLQSALAKLPFNNKMAVFGATPSGDFWNLDMNYDFAHTSGEY